jgi:hypothetical protein
MDSAPPVVSAGGRWQRVVCRKAQVAASFSPRQRALGKRRDSQRRAAVAQWRRDILGALGSNMQDSRRSTLGADDRWLDKAQRPRTVMPRAGAALICAPPSEPERSYTDITDENGLTQIGGLIGVKPLFRCSSVYRLYCQWRPTPLPQSPITNHRQKKHRGCDIVTSPAAATASPPPEQDCARRCMPYLRVTPRLTLLYSAFRKLQVPLSPIVRKS